MPRFRGGTGGPDPLKNHKVIGFPNYYWSVSPGNHKSYQASVQCLGQPRPVSETPFKCPAFSGIWDLSPLIN